MRVTLVLLTLLVVLATALPLLRLDHWWIRVFDFPRVQIACAGAIFLALNGFLWRPGDILLTVSVVLLTLSVLFQITKIYPYTVLMPKQVKSATSSGTRNKISLLVANVLMENREAPAFLEIVKEYNPDIVLTMEADDWWAKALNSLEENYPHTLKLPLDNTYGMLVHSRFALINPQVRFILDDAIPSMHMQVMLASNDRVYLHFVHPDPPNPRHASETTERDAELLIVGREIDKRDRPTIIAGDLNDVAWSRTTALFRKASGLLDPRVGRGMFNSYNAMNTLLRWPLDHVFHSEHFKLDQISRCPAWGSDHFPIFIRLSLEPDAKSDQVEPDTSQSESEQVDQAIANGRHSART